MTEVGRITRVQLNQDDTDIQVDVSFSPGREKENIKFRSPQSGVWFIPSVGDVVEVTEFGGDEYIAHSPMQTPGFGLPDGVRQGDIIIKLSEQTELTFRANADGTHDVDLNFDGDLLVNGERLATESHTHGYSWTDPGGSGDTDEPNEDGLA